MDGVTLFWTWVAGFLTLCIFSFLYKDNPFYKFAEHVYVGVSAGYTIAEQYNDVLKPLLFENLWLAGHALWFDHKMAWDKWHYVVPAILGVMLIMRLFPGVGWVSRWPLAFIVGMGTGYNVVLTMDAQILAQIQATIVHLWSPKGFLETFTLAEFFPVLRSWLILLGVCSGLIYFYFSKEHRGLIYGGASRVGIAFLMVTFGSAFGMTVMARVSLLIGRMLFIINEWIYGTLAYFHLDSIANFFKP